MENRTNINEYRVDNWPVGNCYEDLGLVLNSIICDIKSKQLDKDSDERGKPGAVIYIPPGDFKLRTPVIIDISFLRIEGKGHGFISSSIRHNMNEDELSRAIEIWPGGSRVLVDLSSDSHLETIQRAAFIVGRQGTPRISSVEFVDFCIDGLHFEADGSNQLPENTYRNGKIGILVKDPNDSMVVRGMGFIYLESALRIHYADALSIHSNFIAENGSCIELLGWGQASKINNNLIGAGPNGHGIYAENHGGLLITSNNIFPRGASSITLKNVMRSNISANRLHAFYPGMVRLLGNCGENLVSANHFVRDHEPWLPFVGTGNGLDDSEGLLIVEGEANSISSNHFSMVQHGNLSGSLSSKQTAIKLRAGRRNFVSSNNVVASKVKFESSENCFEAQVESLTAAGAEYFRDFTAVSIESSSKYNTILDSGELDQVSLDPLQNAFRPTPSLTSSAD